MACNMTLNIRNLFCTCQPTKYTFANLKIYDYCKFFFLQRVMYNCAMNELLSSHRNSVKVVFRYDNNITWQRKYIRDGRCGTKEGIAFLSLESSAVLQMWLRCVIVLNICFLVKWKFHFATVFFSNPLFSLSIDILHLNTWINFYAYQLWKRKWINERKTNRTI